MFDELNHYLFSEAVPLMGRMTKIGLTIVVLGACLLGLGYLLSANTADENGANIGAGVMMMASPFIAGLGLILAIAGLVTRSRREQH